MCEDSRYKPIDTNFNNVSFNKSTNLVNKRSEKRPLKERLSKIVSVYVPSDDAEKVLLRFNDDLEIDVSEERGGSLLQSLDEGLSYEVRLLCSLRDVLGRDDAKITCACVSDEKLWLCLEGESQVYILKVNEDEVKCESVWLPKVQGESVYPLEMKASKETLLISGKVLTHYIIVKYDHHENFLASTKRYTHQRFGSFDVDHDGDLLLLSPQLQPDCRTSQISKLAESFQSRRYYINIGEENTSYLPISVAAHGPGGRAWVTLTKTSPEEHEYRLMCFHCCVDPSRGDKELLRTSLDSSRWRMADYKLGVLATLGDYVLAIDQDQHNLCFISWDHTQDHPLVKTISSPGSPTLTYLCSDGKHQALLFTEQSIFIFKFHEQLIKDSEILV